MAKIALRDFMRRLYLKQGNGTPRKMQSIPQKDPWVMAISQEAEVKGIMGDFQWPHLSLFVTMESHFFYYLCIS